MKAGFSLPSNKTPAATFTGRMLCRCWRAVPYAGTVVLFAFIFSEIPYRKVLQAFYEAPALKFAALFLPYSIVYFLLDAYSLMWIVRRFNGHATMREIMPIRASMYLVTMINTNLGQGGVAYYLHRKLRIGFLEACSSVLFLVVVETYVLFVFSSVAALLFQPHHPAPLQILSVVRPIYIGGWAMLILLGVLFSIAHSRRRLHRWIERSRIGPLAKTFIEARPMDYLTVSAIRIPGLLGYFAVEFLALKLYGVYIPVLKLMAFLPLVFLANALPVALGHLGTTQAAWLFLFADNATPAKVIAFSLAAHFTFMSCHALIGLCFLRQALRDLTPHWQPAQATSPAASGEYTSEPTLAESATATPGPDAVAESD